MLRYGVKQLTYSPSLKSLDQWIREEPENKEEAKLSLEVDICRRAEKRRREEETFEYVSYPNHLSNRDWKDERGELTLWKPPGYFEEMEDYCTSLLYSTEPIQEENLPPVYIKKEKKHDSSVGQINSVVSSPVSGLPLSPADNKPKIRRDDNVTAAPKSLFDRPKPFKTIARPRPPGALNPVSFPSTTLTTQIQNQTIKTVPREGEYGPDWLIQEDWALHQAVISLQEMPLSLSANSPAHISNWDMVSDMVNAVSKCYRSPRQCRTRYETTVLPREEGKILYNDITPTKKQKKTGKLIKGIEKKPSISKPMKTSVLFKQDNNNAWSTQFSSRFQTIKAIANKRTPTTKPLLVNSTQRNPKHASVLAEFGVDYDNPLNPVSVAANRADRILRDKQRNQQAAAQAQLSVQQPNVTAVPQQQQPPPPQQQQQQQQQQMLAMQQRNNALRNVTNSPQHPHSGIISGKPGGMQQVTGMPPRFPPRPTVPGMVGMRAQVPGIPQQRLPPFLGHALETRLPPDLCLLGCIFVFADYQVGNNCFNLVFYYRDDSCLMPIFAIILSDPPFKKGYFQFKTVVLKALL